MSQDIGAILVQGIRAASVVPTFMSQVAASMLAVAAARFSAQGYEAPLRSGFIRHGVLPPSMAVAATHASARTRALAASPSESKTLPTLQLSVAEYGLGVPSIVVYAAAEPKRLQVAGAALAVGAAPSPGEDQAAKSFFEDLLRRGRLKIPRAGKGAAETFVPRRRQDPRDAYSRVAAGRKTHGAAPRSYRLRVRSPLRRGWLAPI